MKRSEHKDNMRKALIDAAEKTIVTEGVQALKARALASDVGCALGAIYSFFPDMNALIIAVNHRTLMLLEDALDAARGKPVVKLSQFEKTAAVERLAKLSLAYLEFASAHQSRWRAIYRLQMPGGETMPIHPLELFHGLFEYFAEPLRVLRPQSGEADIHALARSCFAAIHGIVDHGLDSKLGALSSETLRQQVALVSTSIGRGLQDQASIPWLWPW